MAGIAWLASDRRTRAGGARQVGVLIRAKIGTEPVDHVHVYRKRVPPRRGQVVYVRPADLPAESVNRYQPRKARVLMIDRASREDPTYYLDAKEFTPRG